MTMLNLKHNKLTQIPRELQELLTTAVYLEGNPFECNDCAQIYLLRDISQRTNQNIVCSNGRSIYSTQYYISCDCVPYLISIVVSVLIGLMAYGLCLHLQEKRLHKKFNTKIFWQINKNGKEAFFKEGNLLKKIQHERVRRLKHMCTKKTGLLNTTGIYFLERVECSLRQYFCMSLKSRVELNSRELIKDLLRGIDYLHTEKCMIHGNIDPDSVFLQLDETRRYWRLKIGDFTKAQIFPSASSHDKLERKDTLTSIDVGNSKNEAARTNFEIDLLSCAKTIFFILTGKNKKHDCILELQELSSVDWAILILALGKGVPASNGLELPPFHTYTRKMAFLTLLNKRRLQDIAQNVKRDDGGSLWTRAASVILQEFEHLFPPLKAETLPHVLHMAYDLCDVPMDDTTFIKHLLIDVWPQSKQIPSYKANVESIYLSVDRFGTWIPKINMESISSTEVEKCTDFIQTTPSAEDSKTLAFLVYFIKTWESKNEKFSMDEFLDSADIEMDILILSLQEGLTPAEALLTPPFQDDLKKKTILEELSAFLKQQKSEMNKKGRVNGFKKVLEDVESNSRLVIGGKGAWNLLFPPEILDEFASNNGYGYDLISYADLLRIVRNIFQHGHECPQAMLAAFGIPKPSPVRMMKRVFGYFPFLYLHTVSCFSKLFPSRLDSVPQSYVNMYDKFETMACALGIAEGTIKPLKSSSTINVQFESATEDVVQHIVNLTGKTRSFINFSVIAPEITQQAAKLWQNVQLDSLIVQIGDKAIKLSKATSHSSSTNSIHKV